MLKSTKRAGNPSERLVTVALGNVRGQVVATPAGSVGFDDTVLDKNAVFASAQTRLAG